VIRDIEKADDLASSAMGGIRPEKMEEAIELRPNDWRLREQDALYKVSYESAKNDDLFANSDDLVREQIKGGNCVSLRTQQLEYRENFINDSIHRCNQGLTCYKSNLAAELGTVQELLYNIYDTGTTPWCSEVK